MVHSAVRSSYILCSEKKPGQKKEFGCCMVRCEWHRKDITDTLCECRGTNEGSSPGLFCVLLFFFFFSLQRMWLYPDCSNINLHVYIHTQNIQGRVVYRHTHTHTRTHRQRCFSKPKRWAPEKGSGQQVVLIDRSKQRFHYETRQTTFTA